MLIIVNVALLFWPSETSVPSHVYPHKVDVNAELLRLNKEVELAYQEQQRQQAEAALSTVDSSDAADVSQSLESQCYRLGPFSLRSNFEIAQATLRNAGLAVESSTRAVTRTEVYRVFMGPFIERTEAIDMRTTLNNRGVLDHFIRAEPDQGFIVSLGIFTTQSAAQQGAESFASRVPGVQVREELVTLPESYWLYFELDGTPGLRENLESVDWGEVGAQIGSFACQ